MVSSKRYDVFLSFRGEDTRKKFTSHLYDALKQKKVETFIDYRLEKGEEISTTLIKAIEDSHISIVILSENYASSKWCLGELCNIMECKKEKGQIVIPVFYDVDPSHVRKQTGSYEQFFVSHKGEPNCNKWKAALTEASNLVAWDSRAYRGKQIDHATNILEAFDFSATSGIEVLLDRALITISGGDQLEMHDLIQEMGWEVVHQECIKDPGKQSRLWKHEEVCDVLKNNKGTEVVEGIILNLSKLVENLFLSSDSLAKMTNMRFLKIHGWSKFTIFNVCFPNGLDTLSHKMRYLYWDGFCLESLPSNFCAEQLVELCMRCSKLKKLWDGVQNLVNLKTIDLWGSRDLIEIPDLSKAEKLENVSLCYCESLWQLQVHSKSLRVLNLYGCSSLRKFSVTSDELTKLNLAFTAICSLPSSIWLKGKLKSLYLKGCCNLQELTDEPRIYGSQKHFSTFASNVERLSMNIKNLSTLTMLWLDDCKKLVSLPKLWPSLEKLSASNCISLDSYVTQWLVLQHMLHSRIPYIRKHYLKCYDEEYFFPGDHVIDECGFCTTESSITIPYLLKTELYGFIYSIVLSKGSVLQSDVSCSVYQDGIRVGWLQRLLEYESLISNHVLFMYHDINEFHIITELHGHFFCNITFIFENSGESIKEIGVFPIYGSGSGLKLADWQQRSF
ncbi:unnamed protein product [Sphenostylis stenocarpa]|uniref:TIR domain-containing protein n=1 Tax=Sphenostylis stenocarpa TaxID=92480 RepID=A0AA86TIS5_9FABA|nr:unnamed protein product [Sphenostylis stenocarpa]